MNAIILANALVYTSPSSDKNAMRSKQQTWNNFLKILDWDSKTKTEKKNKMTNPVVSLQRLGIPVMGELPKKEKDVNKE